MYIMRVCDDAWNTSTWARPREGWTVEARREKAMSHHKFLLDCMMVGGKYYLELAMTWVATNSEESGEQATLLSKKLYSAESNLSLPAPVRYQAETHPLCRNV